MSFRSRLPLASLLAALALPLHAADDIWREVALQGQLAEANSRLYRADEAALRARLAFAPHEVLLDDSLVLELPMPDGERQRFVVVDSPILAPDLAAKFPRVKTYKLTGLDDPAASGRADLTSNGFRAMLQTSNGVLFIDPDDSQGQSGIYRSRYRTGLPRQGFSCGVHSLDSGPLAPAALPPKPANRLAGNLQTYRIAVAATNDFVAFAGSVDATRNTITTAINRVNQIFERDLGIRLLLVANDGLLIEDESESCFTDGDQFANLDENQIWIDQRIGNSAYDIGHVFGIGSGGVAGIGSACLDPFKARGVTTMPNPVGDPFYIDLLAHEIGHQMNANHSFNGTSGLCGANRVASAAFEPGSGSTIMSYSGICSDENLQIDSDATFHAGTISVIDQFTATGGSCYGTVANGNRNPTLTPLIDLTIPANTPFRLDVSASDLDLNTLVYQWDQLDSGASTSSSTFGTDLGNNPLFRTYAPQAVSWRDFPALGTQVRGQTDEAEVLPTASRTIDFRVGVRDNASGLVSDDVRLTVVDSTGFRVTSQSGGGNLDTRVTPYTITWDQAGTETYCANVDIHLITFDDVPDATVVYENHSLHPIVTGVPNTGTASVATPLPNSHPRARIRVKCTNSVFYNISDADLNVIGTNATLYVDNTFVTFFNSSGLTVSRPGGAPASPVSLPAASSVGDDGRVDVFAGGLATAAQLDACEFDATSLVKDATAIDWRLLSLLLALFFLRFRRSYGGAH